MAATQTSPPWQVRSARLELRPFVREAIGFAGKWIVEGAGASGPGDGSGDSSSTAAGDDDSGGDSGSGGGATGGGAARREILLPGLLTYDPAGRSGDPHASERVGAACAKQAQQRVDGALTQLVDRALTLLNDRAPAASLDRLKA